MAESLVVEFVPAIDHPAPAPRLTRSGVPRKQRVDLMSEPRRCDRCGFFFFKSSQYSGHRNACTKERPWDGMPNRKRNTELVGAISTGTATRKRVKILDKSGAVVRTVTSKIGHPHDGVEGAGSALPRLRIAARTGAPVLSNLLMSRHAPTADGLVCVAKSESTVLDLAVLLGVPTTPAAAERCSIDAEFRGIKRAREESERACPAAKKARTDASPLPTPLKSTPVGASPTPLAQRIFNAESVEELEHIARDINESITFLRKARAFVRELTGSVTRKDTDSLSTPMAPETPHAFA
jgi:hypothetical protein